MPGRYRIDYLVDDRSGQPRAIACDGERLRKLYHNRLVTAPPRLLAPAFARLIDPAWLLEHWQLSAAGEALAGGRRGFQVIAEPPAWVRRDAWTRRDDRSSCRVAVVIDAELGIVLRQVSYASDRPAVRFELRGVTAARPGDAADFGLAAPAGIPVIESGGGPLQELDLSAPVRAASTALLQGATAATSWLQRRLKA